MDPFVSAHRIPKTLGRAIGGLVLLGVVLGGCNVFGGLVPSPETVDALVEDARTALAAGHTTRAVRLYERALEKDSTDVRVRVGLGNALYADRGLDVFALRRAAEHLIGAGGPSGASAAERGARTATTCTDGARPASSTRYDAVSLGAEPIQELTGYAPVVERVRRLVVAGALENRDGGFASAAPRLRRIGFLVGSVTTVARQVGTADRVFGEVQGTLYFDPEPASDGALFACAPTGADLRRVHGALCRLGEAARQGAQWLRERTQSTDGAQGSVLGERLRTLDDVIRARIDCS
ncbi:MAG: hypothetical protein V5A58_09920 [Salinibacter sp.]|uniref:tetratricopeptide repeat protein n=1 Tax=Salinibacter sp. TaxID=2065818 RepID=UPI002FC2B78F